MPTEAEIQAELEAKRNEKVTFDDRQQEKVNELLRDAQGRAGREAREKAQTLETELATLKSELDEAKRVAAAAKTTTAKKEAGDDVADLRAQIEEMRKAHSPVAAEMERMKQSLQVKDAEVLKAKQGTSEVRKEVALVSAAAKINPFEVDEVVNATKNAFVWDENTGRLVVVDPSTGQPRLNSAFERMSVDEFYAEYASKKPYMVRGTAKAGTGSTESTRYDVSGNGKYAVEQIFGPKSSGKDAQALVTSNPKEFARLKQIAIDSGLIGGRRSNR